MQDSEDILINMYPDEPDNSSVDRDRIETAWGVKSEILLQEYSQICKKKQLTCSQKYLYYKKLNNLFNLPCICIPLILSGLQPIIADYVMITNVSLILTGILSGINAYFGHSKKSERFHSHDNLYAQLSMSIDLELNKRKRDRIAADVFVERSHLQLSFINSTFPD